MLLGTGQDVGEILDDQEKKGFLKPEWPTGLFYEMKTTRKTKRNNKKKSKRCIKFSMNVEVEYLDFLLYIWKISG
jgi:hypothetical protein